MLLKAKRQALTIALVNTLLESMILTENERDNLEFLYTEIFNSKGVISKLRYFKSELLRLEATGKLKI